MKIAFLNSIGKRIGFSFALASVIAIIGYFIYGDAFLTLETILITLVIVYIPVTVIYAVVTTFFSDKKKIDNDDVLDR
ncbi:MAG: hypothetical protein GQ574_19115 [Crocinitomix sp.]|nr:hypothetical protein [Crocinitomix sp.]